MAWEEDESPHVVVLEKCRGDLFFIEEILTDAGYLVHRMTSVLQAIEFMKVTPVRALVCGEKIQIGSVLTLPHWVMSEVGSFPSYFIVSEYSITMDDILTHQGGKMVTKLFSNFEELKALPQILERIEVSSAERAH